MQVFLVTKDDPNLDELHMVFALAAAKLEQNPELTKTNKDITLHSPAKTYLGRLTVRGNK